MPAQKNCPSLPASLVSKVERGAVTSVGKQTRFVPADVQMDIKCKSVRYILFTLIFTFSLNPTPDHVVGRLRYKKKTAQITATMRSVAVAN